MTRPQVIDALNFPGYDDKSWTAKQQAMYTDLILINKHELVTDERTLDKTLDDVHELNPETPKVPSLTKPSSLVRECVTRPVSLPSDQRAEATFSRVSGREAFSESLVSASSNKNRAK